MPQIVKPYSWQFCRFHSRQKVAFHYITVIHWLSGFVREDEISLISGAGQFLFQPQDLTLSKSAKESKHEHGSIFLPFYFFQKGFYLKGSQHGDFPLLVLPFPALFFWPFGISKGIVVNVSVPCRVAKYLA